MQGVSEFRHQPGMRRLPRPGAAGSSLGLLRMPGLRARRSRRGQGPGERSARMRSGWGVTFVPFFTAARTLLGRLMPVRERIALRPAARSFLAPPKGVTRCGVQPHGSAGAQERPCLRPAGNRPYAPSRGAGKAAASSRCALPSRRASVVSTVSASERVETTLGKDRRPIRKPLNKGGLRVYVLHEMPFWAKNARKRALQNG